MLSKVLEIRQLDLIPQKMSFWKFFVDPGFSNKPYDKKRKHGNAEKAPIINGVPLLENY